MCDWAFLVLFLRLRGPVDSIAWFDLSEAIDDLEEPNETLQQVISDLENINAHLFSIEALMERVFDVKVPEAVEQKFREFAGELAPDPLNADRIRLNRLLHQTPDLPDRN